MHKNVPEMHTFSDTLRSYLLEDIRLRMGRVRGPVVIEAVGIECTCEDGSCTYCKAVRGISKLLHRHDN